MDKYNNISFKYKNKIIFNDANFTFGENDIIGLIGPNGVGKTTLLKIISNIYNPYKDDNINFLIDHPAFFDNLSVYDNLKYFSILYNSQEVDLNKILNVIGLSKDKNTKYSKLSLGMKGRLAIGKCLIKDSHIYLFDEPLNGLDPKGIIMFRSVIKTLHESGKLIIISSHILNELDNYVNKIMYIKNNKVYIDNIYIEEAYIFEVDIIPDIYLQYKVGNNLFRLSITKDKINEIIMNLINKNIKIFEINKDKSKLEQLYLKENL